MGLTSLSLKIITCNRFFYSFSRPNILPSLYKMFSPLAKTKLLESYKPIKKKFMDNFLVPYSKSP